MISNGYGNMWSPTQSIAPAVSYTKTPQELASPATETRAQERVETARAAQTAQVVESRDQAQASNNTLRKGGNIDMYA